MELINKVKTVALGSLAVGSGGVLYGYYNTPATTENKVATKTKKSITKPSGEAYEGCLKDQKITQNREGVCGWLYRGLVRR